MRLPLGKASIKTPILADMSAKLMTLPPSKTTTKTRNKIKKCIYSLAKVAKNSCNR